MKTYWSLRWQAKGEKGHIMHGGCVPVLFRTRKETVAFREETFGYIRKRPDLRSAPHFWRMPKLIKVTVTEA